MNRTSVRTLLPFFLLAMAALLSRHGAARAEDPPALTPVVTNGTCQSLNAIPVADLTAPIQEPLVPWRVTQKYNTTKDDPNAVAPGHNGVDLGGEHQGGKVGVEEIHAAVSGKVLVSTLRSGWGNSIAVVSRLHPSSEAVITTHYHHLHARYVAHCQTVTANQLLGLEGKTGNPKYYAHLHFTVRYWASLRHLQNWLNKKDGDYLVFGNDAYFGHDGLEFRGSYEPGYSSIEDTSPYIHYGHLNPITLLHDEYLDYGDGDPPVAHAWSLEFAKKMRYYGIDLGEWNGNFGATMPIRRREAARWLRIAIGQDMPAIASEPPIFADVPQDDPDYPYIQKLARYPTPKSVVNPTNSCVGGSTPNFCPDAEINRAEVLKMVVLAFHADEFQSFYDSVFWVQKAASVLSSLAYLLGVPTSALFSDVEIGAWYAPYVYFGAIKGLVKVQSKFNPGASVTRAELSKWTILGYESLHGEGAVDPCAGVSCSGNMYCNPATSACAASPECVPTEEAPCEVGGGLVNASGDCGDGQCGGSEMCFNCPADCGPCAPCGDGSCNGNETCSSCPQDCGACGTVCGDGSCDGEEACDSCPQDCGACGTVCGDGSCNGNESCSSCAQDCGACGTVCGDGSCDGEEACDSCPQDCGACGTVCGDGSCNGNESCSSCAQDCGACNPVCGDASCNGNDTCSNCPQDCGACPCGEANYWTPTPASETDSTGTQYNATINTSIKVEVRQSGVGLEARVCKVGGTFSNNIAFSIYDAVTSSTTGVHVASLATSGLTCSSWVGLQNDTGYSEGQWFGGAWQVVSPASSSSEWGFPYSSCTVSGSPGGTCWGGISISMVRTCK